MRCAGCGAENKPGRRFCSQCGASLQRLCASCAAPYDEGERFCGECGSPLEAVAAQVARPQLTAVPSLATASLAATDPGERRHVTVLFADLVGFTPLSEQRDAEDVRELLSRYFATARTIIARYGGTVEKFIGDAVMAVWGVPVVHESDAERAVRAALELVDAVAAFGEAVAAPDLRARAGVLTGEAAIRVGVIGEGMVAGDLVNTASRVQSVAEPGSVFVGDATRQSSEARVARAQGQAGASPPLACPARRRQPRSMQQAPTRRRSRRMHIGEDRAAGLCVAHVLLISLTRETP